MKSVIILVVEGGERRGNEKGFHKPVQVSAGVLDFVRIQSSTALTPRKSRSSILFLVRSPHTPLREDNSHKLNFSVRAGGAGLGITLNYSMSLSFVVTRAICYASHVSSTPF